jgi:hypothetical protein
LQYKLTSPSSSINYVYQSITIGRTDTAITNIGVVRSVLSNQGNQLVFANTVPQILETISNASYTISLVSTSGYFGLTEDNITSNYSFTGNASQTNQILSTIKFYPFKDVVGYKTFTYLQSRTINGVTINQANQSIYLFFYPRTTPIPGAGTYPITSSTTTYEQKAYLKANIVVLGSGGNGGAVTLAKNIDNNNSISPIPGGGGAGANLVSYTGTTINSTLTIIIGNAGSYSAITGNLKINNSYVTQVIGLAGQNGGLGNTIVRNASSYPQDYYGGRGGNTASYYAGNPWYMQGSGGAGITSASINSPSLADSWGNGAIYSNNGISFYYGYGGGPGRWATNNNGGNEFTPPSSYLANGMSKNGYGNGGGGAGVPQIGGLSAITPPGPGLPGIVILTFYPY